MVHCWSLFVGWLLGIWCFGASSCVVGCVLLCHGLSGDALRFVVLSLLVIGCLLCVLTCVNCCLLIVVRVVCCSAFVFVRCWL